MAPWAARLRPSVFSILGGEPTLNRHLTDLVRLSRTFWPHSLIRIVTNGFFLDRHPDLPTVLSTDRNTVICLSIHHGSSQYLNLIKPQIALLSDWVDTHGIKTAVNHSYQTWTLRFKGYGSVMEPYHDSRIRDSWQHCPSKHCKQLHEEQLWKCPPLAYLQLQAKQFTLSSNWNRYLSYEPLAATCSDLELQTFLTREEEAYCGMCPAEPQKISPAMPTRRPLLEPGDLQSHDNLTTLQQLRSIDRWRVDTKRGICLAIDDSTTSP